MKSTRHLFDSAKGIHHHPLSLAIISVLAFGVNGALLRVSAVAPAIYVIYIRLQSFVIMPADGMRDAGISIISYNHSIGKMIKVGIPALRIISIAFPLTGGTHILNGYLQALGHSDKTFLTSIVQAILLVGGAWLWSLTGSVNLIWLAFPIMEVILFALSVMFAQRVYKERVEGLGRPDRKKLFAEEIMYE